jgi:hypothetical protein
MPPPALKGVGTGNASGDFAEDVIEQAFLIEKAEISAYLAHIERTHMGRNKARISSKSCVRRGLFTNPCSSNPISPSGLMTRNSPNTVFLSIAVAKSLCAIGRGANDFIRRQSQPANQRKSNSQTIERGNYLFNLLSQA